MDKMALTRVMRVIMTLAIANVWAVAPTSCSSSDLDIPADVAGPEDILVPTIPDRSDNPPIQQ